ncbi:serine protease FAM111A-like isoform X2 [Epinephelus fuscoguttatus]|nr:serine protease FAM111A-like isoform X2 [Epinephelus fuscoguttatus]
MGEHLHRFTVKFSPTDRKEYAIACDRPCTVLEVLKSTENYSKKMRKCADENIVIQLGKEDKASIVATHFPCTCIRDGESLIISCEAEIVEAAKDQLYNPIQSREKYSVFYIDREGGLNTKQKKLFRSKAVKQFKYLCVYGQKGMTVEEALKRDGRFINDLGVFELSDNDNPSCLTEYTQKVDTLDQKKLKLCLPRKKKRKGQPADQKANQYTLGDSHTAREPNSDEVQQSRNTASNAVQRRARGARTVHQQSDSNTGAVGQQGGSSVSAAGQQSIMVQRINDYVCRQFPSLREWMENQFPGDSYQQTLDLKREDFGKIQNSFSEVDTVRKLVELGGSVCLLEIDLLSVKVLGTGFVLFDNFILTNAHLFKQGFESKIDNWQKYLKVIARFNYENQDSESNWISFSVKRDVVFSYDLELDYAVLELDLEAQNENVPPGLLKHFGPMPLDGGACLIGHPAGEVKKMDPTCIIEKEKREQAVSDYLKPYNPFIVHQIRLYIKAQGIDSIMKGSRAENVVTYPTFMYHGSSGSPVFDAHGRVFGLHTAGFHLAPENTTDSVIEFAQPLLTIFEHFVSKLKESGDEELLKRVQEEAMENPYLEKVFECSSVVKPEPEDPEDHSDFIESMDTN